VKRRRARLAERRRVTVFQVDAFTDRLWAGNPAGVVPEADGLSEELMQRMAREMNVSETAFVSQPTAEGADLRVRFFTPTDEVDLCGHATIATFHLLATHGYLEDYDREGNEPLSLRQETKAGLLQVRIDRRGGRVTRVMMEQARPRLIGTWGEEDVAALCRLLRVDTKVVDRSGLPVQVVGTGLPDLIVPLPDRRSLWALDPDLGALARFCRERDVVSVHAFTREAMDGGDAHCRDFSPAVGVPEEAATGTASGALGAYLAFNDRLPAGDEDPVRITLEQGHILDRPSRIEVEIRRRGGRPTAVWVGGPARVVLRGEFLLDS